MNSRLALDGRAVGVMVLLCLIWSLQQISLKAAAAHVSPMLMIGMRSAIAAVLVAALTRLRGQTLSPSPGNWRAGLVVGSLFALEFLLVAQAVRDTYAAHVVVFLYTAPVFAALGLHWKLPEERLHWLQWVGIGIAFAGIATAFFGSPAQSGALDTRHVLLGDFFALLAGAAWGATTVTVRCSRLSSAAPTETLLYQLVGAGGVLLVAAPLLGEARFDASPTAWAHLAFQTVVVSFASFLAWFWLLRRYLASRLGVFSFMTPVFGVVLGVLLLAEPLEPGFVAGALLVVAGILLVSGARGLLQVLSVIR